MLSLPVYLCGCRKGQRHVVTRLKDGTEGYFTEIEYIRQVKSIPLEKVHELLRETLLNPLAQVEAGEYVYWLSLPHPSLR